MSYKIRHITDERKFCDHLSIDAISDAVSIELIQEVLDLHNASHKRHRKLTMSAVVLIIIAMNLFSHFSIGHVVRRVFQGLRFIWPDPDFPPPKHNAISYRRYQLGPRPLVSLFHRVAQPMATDETRGAFAFGLRLMALDGSIEEAPDTPENDAAFGRLASDRGKCCFVQIQAVYLVECGTHAIIDAGFWPAKSSERVGGFRLLRSLGKGMLLMWDRGFHSYDMVVATLERGSQCLGRLPDNVKPEHLCTLEDGTWLGYIRPTQKGRRNKEDKQLVRIISYTFTDPTQAGYQKRYRIVTTLLDERKYPAKELVCLYHERWEIEIVIDEIDTHQRLAGRPLRSLKPEGVIQELYALLIAHYAVRKLIHEAANEAEVDPDRISFVGALRIIQEAIPEFQMVEKEQKEQLYKRLLRDIGEQRLPERRARSNPRVVKRKMSGFNLKRPQHYNWPKPQLRFCDAILLI